MTDMVERVARAICDATGTIWGGPRGEEDPDFMLSKMAYMKMARAAIEAMREPTEPMTEAGAVESGGATKAQAIEWAKLDKFEDRQAEAGAIFTAMIDAALSPNQNGG